MAVLKFMAEFVLNKTQRLTFDSSSPNGILLFRQVSKVTPLWRSCSTKRALLSDTPPLQAPTQLACACPAWLAGPFEHLDQSNPCVAKLSVVSMLAGAGGVRQQGAQRAL